MRKFKHCQKPDYSLEQVLTPISLYAGQKLTAPVNNGTRPIKPHKVLGPKNTRDSNAKPITTRIALSIVPTFFMTISPKILLHLYHINQTS